MERLSLWKGEDKIDKESVKAFLSYFLASESPRGGLVEDWIKCDDDVMRLEPDFVIFNGSPINNYSGQRIAINYSKIKSIEINYLDEDEDALALYISCGHLCLVFDRAITIKPEIYEMIERDNAEEFEW